MAHNEPSHLDLRCLTFSLSLLHINFFRNDTLLEKQNVDDKCRLKFGTERVKALITIAAEDRRHFEICFYIVLNKEIGLDTACESSTKQTILLKKCQNLFSLKIKQNLECRLLQSLFCALWV